MYPADGTLLATLPPPLSDFTFLCPRLTTVDRGKPAESACQLCSLTNEELRMELEVLIPDFFTCLRLGRIEGISK